VTVPDLATIGRKRQGAPARMIGCPSRRLRLTACFRGCSGGSTMARRAATARVSVGGTGGYAARVVRAAAVRQLGRAGARGELSVLLVGDAKMRRLNRSYRGTDRTTDVLSFPQGGEVVGDVVISVDTARRQAREGGWPLSRELQRLLAHGILHCLGHDHHQPREARRMAAAERRLLGREGMVGTVTSDAKAVSSKRRVR
jgi:rRNA maturation RNase YbeY